MPKAIRYPSAHPSFPISFPALQSVSLRPDSIYFEPHYARQLSASLVNSKSPFSAGELSAVGLMGKIYLAVIDDFLNAASLDLAALDRFLVQELTLSKAESVIEATLSHFPTVRSLEDPHGKSVYRFDESSPASERHRYYLSLVLILVADQNPALIARDGFFTDPSLRKSADFQDLSNRFIEFFSGSATESGPGNNLLDLLVEPSRLHPDSLLDQLSYISQIWGAILDPSVLENLQTQMDQLKEEYRLPDRTTSGYSGNPLGQLISAQSSTPEDVRFSSDGEWMPRVVLQAKNAFVWLDQLSRQYQRPINRLDQIPEEELAALSSSGINALWLIGLWERSPASQKIKQISGNPEAVASAYSLYDYAISGQLGGENAYQQLFENAAKYNIKLAADMVPNHVGIDSVWVAEQPDWLISLDEPPFPAYSFNGENLSSDPSVSIFLEDHYYDQSDASVVFKRVDQKSGATSYPYHGNDGTSMPWNDTAQLDFLNPDLREAVIQTILHVAKKFPIIRFDAAMTLTKKHFQRLWFPEPGSGGAIPTRSRFGLTKESFNSRMPEEFWREVVDRVAEEAPDTLLLAEAFWMMEGYFVRNLGMHRVYNSAFMHLLRDEDNHKYRELIIDTLELDPQILKRFVNFLNNPDEDTAITQFGSDGKYFGTCLLMCTLPGLPMFGHGQIEGLTEKYGMEYKKAYLDESPNTSLVGRHQAEIFPILQRRYLFADVENFTLYDFEDESGEVCQDVFAYSNRFGSESSLIVYHNKWGTVEGLIKRSAAVNGISHSLLDCLGLIPSDDTFLLYTDIITGLEYIHSTKALDATGLIFQLGAFEYHAFLDFRLMVDTDGSYQMLFDRLAGNGTPNLEALRNELIMEPLAHNFSAILAHFIDLGEQIVSDPETNRVMTTVTGNKLLQENVSSIITGLQTRLPHLPAKTLVSNEVVQARLIFLSWLVSEQDHQFISAALPLLIPWIFLTPADPEHVEDSITALFNSYIRIIQNSDLISPPRSELTLSAIKTCYSLWFNLTGSPLDIRTLNKLWFTTSAVTDFLKINSYEGQTYFHKESMEILFQLTFALYAMDLSLSYSPDESSAIDAIHKIVKLYRNAAEALVESKFRLDDFASLLKTGFEGG